MGQSRSRAVAARQAALDKLLAQQRERLEVVAEAAVNAQSAQADRERLATELAAAELRFRSAVAAMSDAGQSPEQIAHICDLDVALVRSARRPKSAPGVPGNGAPTGGLPAVAATA